MIESAVSALPPDGVVDVHYQCPVCGHESPELFFQLAAVPVHCNILWSTADEARRAARGAISLALCSHCGLVFNAAFDPSLVTYDESYENSLHYSPRFEAYAETLAQDLSDRLGLQQRLIVEVGCGKGEFLRRLCETAGARGLGIDASYDPDVVPLNADDTVTFLREPFSSLPDEVAPALILCRHVLEHLPNPRPFVAQFAAAARRSPGCRVFLEVPNVLFTLKDFGIWDLIYEHCAYFSAPALSRLCEASGLSVERVYPAFGNQFLCAEATAGRAPSPPSFSDELRELSSLAEGFAAEYRRKVRFWQTRLRELEAGGRRIALWGAGSKGITFVNTVPGGENISCLVDLNPRKQGRFVPGTGHVVVAPETLREVNPDVLVVMNPLYRDEIERLTNQMGLQCIVEVA
jgi:SAM-dependent methyltransferase